MSRIAYVNGAYLPHRRAAVHIEDRGFQFADGVYEVVAVLGGRLIDPELHLDRLDRSLTALAIAPPIGRAALSVVLREVLQRNRLRDGLLYLQITRGSAPREHAFPSASLPTLVVTARRIPGLPEDLARWAVGVITLPDERWARCDIKSVSLLPNVLAKQTARKRGAFEAVLIDHDGLVTEGASSTIWIVDRNDRLCTRHLDRAILPGCTRAALIAELACSGLKVEERAFTRAELMAAREVFLTSASSFVRPIIAIDGTPVADGRVGPRTAKLAALYAARACP